MRIILTILFVILTTSKLYADPDFAKFLLNEEQVRIHLAIEELKHQMTYVKEEHYELLEQELNQLIDDLQKNLKEQFEIQKVLNSQQ
ncbi:MAG: hypothetical protein CBC05_02920 [Crocinitomicaceae bacterium TMED45]|nr:MAG: hypothetical protein CBC05_02920 [Crocinitomicaceae bacterium TMED45]|tara:strand:+ start:100 stop:360 length:261 start_codon:yes stop_codon:yes gene_type:complete